MPQPIDVQTELARITTLERVQQISDRLSLAAHQRMADQAEQQQVAAETQAHEAEQKSDEVNRDAHHGTPERRGRRRGEAEPDGKKQGAAMPPVPPPEEHRLDISV